VGDVDWGTVAILVGVLVPSVILHEVSHGLVAYLFGDDTARRAGRLTLNPLPHIDPFGTLILPLILSLSGLGAFGYAKPVPVNTSKLRRPREQSLYVSLIGPVVNVALALLAALLLSLLTTTATRGNVILLDGERSRILFYFGLVNVILAVFNLLPIPPLDGSALVERWLPDRYWPTWSKVRQWGLGIVLLVVFVLPGGLSFAFEPAVELWSRLL
jgi:Zn-dependent protease